MAKESCDSCGRVVQRGARFCPSCGVELSAAVLVRVLDGDSNEGAHVALVELRPSRRPLLIAAATAAGVAFVAIVLTVSRPAPLAPTRPSEVAITATTVPAPTTVPASTTTEPLLAAHKVSLPAGLHGQAWFLMADGSVVRLDLSTGLLNVVADAVIDRIYGIASENARFVVLDDGIMVWIGGRVAMVSTDGDAKVVAVGEDLDFITGGDHYVVLRREQPGNRIVRVVVDGHGNVNDLPELGSVANVVGVAGDRLVVQAADQIGLLDPTDGTVTPVARGSYVASNRWGLVHLECPQPPACELHTGPWSSLDEVVVPAAVTIPQTNPAGPPQLSADGSAVGFSNADSLQVIDTSTGNVVFAPKLKPRLFAVGPKGIELLTVSSGKAQIDRPYAFPVEFPIGGQTFRREVVGVAFTD